MRPFVFLACFLNFFTAHTCWASEFRLEGDYKLGGVFTMHVASDIVIPAAPVAMKCYTKPFSVSGYQMFQMMRFSVEQINNSTALLPNITLGYEIFDICVKTQNIPSFLDLISDNGQISTSSKVKTEKHNVIGLVGSYSSSDSLVAAPFFTMDLIPMISYSSSSYTLSNKWLYPSFLRTVSTNKDLIQLIIQLIQRFGWNWVAFISSNDDYSHNGLELFRENIKNSSICLAFTYELSKESNYSEVLSKIDSLNINVIIVFTQTIFASELVKAAVRVNVRGKVWIAGDGWSLNQELSTLPGITNIGTIFGITDTALILPGFDDFVYQSRDSKKNQDCASCTDGRKCNQVCENCTAVGPGEILNENPTFSFSIQSAVYTYAHALHQLLNCSRGRCDPPREIPPHVLLQYLKKSSFTLQNRHIQFDKNGDPPASLAAVLWTPENDPLYVRVATYETYPAVRFTLNTDLIPWFKNGTVPYSNCSLECETGFKRVQTSIHKCCFQCDKCHANTYINTTVDGYTCAPCPDGYWSDEKSIKCLKRSIVYLPIDYPLSILFLVCLVAFIVICIGVIILFAINFNTPVVKSAGGIMAFLMLVCLVLANVGGFFFFGVPKELNCALRNVFFIFFYTVCLSCMAVRSFQIVCVFKMAAQFPKVYSWWIKNDGQWRCVGVYSCVQLIVCGTWLLSGRPKPYNDSTSFKDQTILTCDMGSLITFTLVWFCLWILSIACFCFSYMGKDLPKNYNEAKTITFSLLLFYLGWVGYFTAYIVFRGVYIQLLNAVAQLASSYGIVFSFFIPRAYIIMFQPKKNTQAYFQSSIQTYTQTISRL